MKRVLIMLAFPSVLAVPSHSQIAYDGMILDRLNKWDGYPAHLFDGTKHIIWWCSQASDGKDSIWRAQKTGDLVPAGPGGWGTYSQVLTHGQISWADSHICDPSVIRGTFTHGSNTYSHALYFTAQVPGPVEAKIGLAFSNDGISWTPSSAAVVVPYGTAPGYGAGMSGVAYHPANGRLLHAYLDSTQTPILRLNESIDGKTFFPVPSYPTQLHAAGRRGNDGQGPDISYNPRDGYWYAAIKNYDSAGIYDGETRILRSRNANDLLGPWDVIGVFNSTVTGLPQNHNPGLGKLLNGNLYIDSQGWAYVFFSVGQERPNVRTWQIAQGRFRPGPLASNFYALAPCRVVDTRSEGGPLAAGETRDFAQWASCGVPSDASAVSI